MLISLAYVDEDYRGQGLTTQVLKALGKSAREKGINVVSSIVATSHGQGIPSLFNCDVLLEVPYKDNYALYSEMNDGIKTEHSFCRVVAKKLR